MKAQLWVAAMLLLLMSPQHALQTPASHAGTTEQSSASASDREKAGFRGLVRSCIEETIEGGRDTETTRREYSVDGKLLERGTSTPYDSGELYITLTYNADGRLAKTIVGHTGVAGNGLGFYTYDSAGRSVSITNSENNDRTDFQYDEHGRKREIIRFDAQTLQRTEHVAFLGAALDAAIAGVGVPAGGNVIINYDEQDRPVEAQIRNADDQVVSRVSRKYSAAGLISEEAPSFENPPSVFYKLPAETQLQLDAMQGETTSTLQDGKARNATFFTYDAQGRVTTKRERGGVIESTTTTTYNEQGDIAEEHTVVSALAPAVPGSIAEHGAITSSAASPKVIADSHVRYAYEYDEYGNWTEQSVTEGGNPDSPSTIHRRTLTYY